MSNKNMNLIIEGLNKLDESNISIKNMEKDIEKAKNKLKKSKMKENFGEDEVRKIRDKYAGLMTDNYAKYSSLISSFEDWCSSYEGTNEESEIDEDRWVTIKGTHVLVDDEGGIKNDNIRKKIDASKKKKESKGFEPDVKSSKAELEKAKKSGDKQREKVAQKSLDRAEKAEAKKKEKKTKVDSLKAELEKAKKSKDEKRIAVAQKKLNQAMLEENKQRKIIEVFN